MPYLRLILSFFLLVSMVSIASATEVCTSVFDEKNPDNMNMTKVCVDVTTIAPFPTKMDNGFNVSTQPLESIIFSNSSGQFQKVTYWFNYTDGNPVPFYNSIMNMNNGMFKFKKNTSMSGLTFYGVTEHKEYVETITYEADKIMETAAGSYNISKLNLTLADFPTLDKHTQTEYLYSFIVPFVGRGNQFNITGFFDPSISACGTYNTSGVYDLTGNLAISGATCLRANASNITFDCHGYSLSGNNASTTYGVYSDQFNTTVKNCNISNFDVGIYFNAASSGTINNNTVTLTKQNAVNPTYSSAIMVVNASSVTVSNNTAASRMMGILIRNSSNNILSDNNVSVSAYYDAIAIYLNSINNQLVRNNATGLRSGLYVGVGANLNNMSNNYFQSTSSATTDGAVILTNANLSIFTNNTINSSATGANRAKAIYLDSGQNNIFTNNTIVVASSGITPAIYAGTVSGNNSFTLNNITSILWVNDTNGTNYYNSSTQGNIYYWPNGTASWEVSPNGTALTTTTPPNWNTNTSAWVNATKFSGSWVGLGTDWLAWTGNSNSATSIYTNVSWVGINWSGGGAQPTTASALDCRVLAINSNDSQFNISINWTKNGAAAGFASMIGYTNNTNTTITTQSPPLTAGDIWSCSAQAISTTNTSAWVTSADVTVAGTDSCTAPAINNDWVINSADNCVCASTNINLGTGAIYYTGTGTIVFNTCQVNATKFQRQAGDTGTMTTIWINASSIITLKT